jgi:hypothetical protein
MDWCYVCALEFHIFIFVGSEMAKTDGVWQICLLEIIMDAASAIFHLFEAFLDFWIMFMFAHWNFKFLSCRVGNG